MQSQADSQLQRGVLAPDLMRMEKEEEDLEVSRGGKPPTKSRHARDMRRGPGLVYITNHTCSPLHAPHVCANVRPSTAHAPGPHSLANEP